MKSILLLTSLTIALSCAQPVATSVPDTHLDVNYTELPSFNPVCDILYRAPKPIVIDGVIDPKEWDAVPYLSDFVDIEGKDEFKPHLSTKVKIAYDDKYFYIAADMETPTLWGEFTKRDDVMCLENDFEVFMDLSGDTHDYLEFEINVRNAVWDLLMTKPYRDGGKCYNGLNYLDYKTAVKTFGTINNPKDTDKGWSVEIAIPWNELLEARPGERKPINGEQYRVNFLRIEYPLKVVDGKYVKDINPKYGNETGNHWTWSPIGRVDLHSPDLYGYIQVSDKIAGTETDKFTESSDEQTKWMLRRLYYRQKQYSSEAKTFATNISTLKPEEIFTPDQISNLKLYNTPSSYEITYDDGDKIWHIVQDGKIWSSK